MIFYRNRMWYVLNVVQCGAKLIPIHDQAAFIAVVAHLACHHFDGHADLDLVVIHVGELGGEHGSLFEFDEGNGVGGVGVVTSGRFVYGGKRIHLAFAAKRI